MSGEVEDNGHNQNFNDCITHAKCDDLFQQICADKRTNVHATEPMFTALTNQLNAMDARLNTIEQHAQDNTDPNRLNRNRHGMGGGGNHNGNNDPFAKVKFSIPSFAGAYDAEAYLDWEMSVDQKFTSHLVPDIHRVRQATSEFKDFALIWWHELVNLGNDPQTWDSLKTAMQDRFVPPSYKRDLRHKLQRLEQGNMSVQEYYQELQKGTIRCCNTLIFGL